MEKKQIKVKLKIVLIFFVCLIFILSVGGMIWFWWNTRTVYIYDDSIEKIEIQYYDGTGVFYAELVNDDEYELHEIVLESPELNEIAALISTLTKAYSHQENKNLGHKHMEYCNIHDNYKLVINDCYSLYIGDKYGIADRYNYDNEKKNIYFRVPEELYSKVKEIVKKLNK